jgi:hypothetical protein
MLGHDLGQPGNLQLPHRRASARFFELAAFFAGGSREMLAADCERRPLAPVVVVIDGPGLDPRTY